MLFVLHKSRKNSSWPVKSVVNQKSIGHFRKIIYPRVSIENIDQSIHPETNIQTHRKCVQLQPTMLLMHKLICHCATFHTKHNKKAIFLKLTQYSYY